MEDTHKELYLRFLELVREFNEIGCPDDCRHSTCLISCSDCLLSAEIYGDYNLNGLNLCDILMKCHDELIQKED